jgi:hypothetical protein
LHKRPELVDNEKIMSTEAQPPVRRITNWPEYNKALVNRGSLTFWFDEAVIDQWFHRGPNEGRGLNKTFSDRAIQTCLMLKGLFGLPLRALQGLVSSLVALMGLSLPCPDYTTIAKRARGLQVAIPRRLPAGPVDIVIDSTGIKVFGEGEWKTRQHGVGKRRTWRKLHLAIDPATHDVVAAQVTVLEVTDAEVFPDLLEQLEDQPLGTVAADGAYDQRGCYDTVEQRGGRALIPPRENAVEWEASHPRTVTVQACRAEGRKAWKVSVGYHRRSLSETAMFRYKQLISPAFSFRRFASQVAEAYAGLAVLNRMNTLGMPVRG